MTDETLFAVALEKPDAAARGAYLDSACTNPEQRQRIDGLLAALEKAGGFLEQPAAAVSETDFASTRMFPSDEVGADDTTRLYGADGDEDTDDAIGFLAPAERPDSLGRIGRYEVLEILGRGGFGIVFRAFDDNLQRVVAVKVLAPSIAATSPARKRFLREARSAAQVQHENVVRIIETGEEPLPYLVMEFVSGETLQQRLDRTGPLDVAETLTIGRQLAEGLAAAHTKGLIHRDIKPSNILIDAGPQQVKITDFGLARAADDASLTRSGVVAGTPMYMAPEQAKGEHIDHRADLFSLGSVLYALLTGRPPFRAETTLAVLKRVADDTPRPMREVIPEVPQWLCRIVEKLHAKNPADRFQTAKEVADLLADCEKQLAAHKEVKDTSRIPEAKAPPAQGRSRRRRFAIATALLAVMIPAWVLLFFSETVVAYAGNQGAIEFRVVSDPDVEHLLVRKDGKMFATLGRANPRVLVPAGEYELEAVSTDGYEATKFHVDTTRFFTTSGSFERVEGRPAIRLTVRRGDTTIVGVNAERRASPPSALVPNNGFVSLFNGKDTSGWKTHPDQPGNWKVENGALVGRGPGVSHLFSERGDYGDFHLQAQVKINAAGDSGIWFRTPFDLPKVSKITGLRYPGGYEAQIYCRPGGDEDGKYTGSLGKEAPVLTSPHQPEQWFDLEIIARGDLVTTLVNGKKTAELRLAGDGPRQGHIALQSGGSNRTTTVEFRKIEIKELPASSPVPSPAVAPFDAAKAKEHQEQWAKHLGAPVEVENSIGMKLRLVPPGQFPMGSTPKEIEEVLAETKEASKFLVKAEGPQRSVRISAPYYMGTFEVTQAEYQRVMGANPSDFAPMGKSAAKVEGIDTGRFPVENVSWDDAVEFCRRLSELPAEKAAGRTYRLATEAQWEYACRAGTTGHFHTGAALREADANFNLALGRPTTVGSFPANAFGLYDLHGNVFEWCHDWFAPDYRDLPALDPQGPNEGTARVVRGGNYGYLERYCRSAARDRFQPTTRRGGIGFRVVITGDLKPKPASPAPAGPSPIVLRKFDPAKDKPAPLWGGDNLVTVEDGAWRIENNTNMGNFKVLFDTLLDGIPKDGLIVFRAKVKVKANHKLAWGSIQLGIGDPSFHKYDWPRHLGDYHGDVPEWTQKEIRYPASVFHQKNPPQIPVYVGLNAAGVVWVKDAEVLHIPEGASPEPVKATGGPVKLRSFDPAKDRPVVGPGSDVKGVTFEEGALRVETGTAGVKAFTLILGEVVDGVPKDGLFVFRAKVKVKAGHKNTWGELQLNFTDPSFHGYDWPTERYRYHGDVSEWTQKEMRYPAAIVHKKNPPTVTMSASLHEGVLWLKDVELWYVPEGAKLDAPKVDASLPAAAVVPFDTKAAEAHQEAWAKHLNTKVEFADKKLGMEFRVIPPGDFQMGAKDDEVKPEIKKAEDNKNYGWRILVRSLKAETPRHPVRITRPFAIGKYEVTVGQFRKFVEETGYKTEAEPVGGYGVKGGDVVWGREYRWDKVGYPQADNAPVWNVSPGDALAFCKWLSEKDGRTFRLPTEAEWEWACRAGTDTRTFWTGDKAADAHKFAWGSAKTGRTPQPVGKLAANPFGLHDICGNVWEWCSDWYNEAYYKDAPAVDPTGPPVSGGGQRTRRRVQRGGGVDDNHLTLNSTAREVTDHKVVGFRIVCEIAGDVKLPPPPNAKDPPAVAALGPLREAIATQEKGRDDVKRRVEAGVASGIDLAAAEATLVEARIRVAEEEKNPEVVADLLEELVTHRQQARDLIALRVKEGVEPPATLTAADTKLADAKARLFKLRPPEPPLEVAPVPRPLPVPIPITVPFEKKLAEASQAEWAAYLGVEVEITTKTGMKFRVVPAGTFDLGVSPRHLAAEDAVANKSAERKAFGKQLKESAPHHRVTITRAFAMGKTEVTVGQFRKFVEATGYKTESEKDGKGGFGRAKDGNWKPAAEFNWKNIGIKIADDFPVSNVSWNDAVAFCKWLGPEYRLPTEAEWEWACRAGTTTACYWGEFGDARVTKFANRGSQKDSLDFIPVKQLEPNAFGLHDMCGNVAEWCHDRYAAYTIDPATDPQGPTNGTGHVIRGGSVHDYPWASSSIYREPGMRGAGFRVVVELDRK